METAITKTNSPTPTNGLTLGQHSLGLLREHFADKGEHPEQTHGWLRDAVEEVSAEWVAQSARIAELKAALAPFAAGQCEHDNGSHAHCRIGPQPNGVTIKPCRVCAARALLAKKEG